MIIHWLFLTRFSLGKAWPRDLASPGALGTIGIWSLAGAWSVGLLIVLLSCNYPIALRTLVELDIPDRLTGAPKTAEELSLETRVDAMLLHRLLQFLAVYDVLHLSGTVLH